jgi:hypothetical protein
MIEVKKKLFAMYPGDEGWPRQCPRMKDLGSGRRGAHDEFEGLVKQVEFDCIIETKLGFTKLHFEASSTSSSQPLI